MKEHPMRESEYLLRPLVKVATESKEKKRAVRKENIRQGSEVPLDAESYRARIH